MVHLAHLIKVFIVFIAAMVSITIINNCILQQGDDELLCAIRGPWEDLLGYLWLFLTLFLSSLTERNILGSSYSAMVSPSRTELLQVSFLLVPKAGVTSHFFSTPFFLQAREEITHEPDIASISKADSHVARCSKGRNASLLASSS